MKPHHIIAVSLALLALQAFTATAIATEVETKEPNTLPATTKAPPVLVETPSTGAKLQNKIDNALKKLAHEPALHKLKRAALRLADADVDSADGWMRSTNLSAILPVLKLTAEHDIERDESLDRYQDEPDRWGADTDRDLGLQVSAQWNLGELVFNPDEVRVYNALANRAARREAVVTLLIGYYFERRRLIVEEYILPVADQLEAIEKKIRIQELTAVIDALTGGLLLSNLKK